MDPSIKPSGPLNIGLLLDTTLDSNDGVQQYVKILGRWLKQQGHKPVYITGYSQQHSIDDIQVLSLSKTIKVKFNGNYISSPLPITNRKARQIINQLKLDVLHVQMPYSPFLAQKLINNCPKQTVVIGTFHILPVGLIQDLGSRLLRLSYGKSASRFDAILAVSQPAANFAKKSYKFESQVIPNMFDYQKYQSARKGYSETAKKIVYLGRLVQRKGILQLLDAFILIHTKLPEAKLIVAGDGPLRQKAVNFVANNNLGDAVQFLGFIDESEKPNLLASANVACFPSLNGESFGIVLIEAMAAGSQVVIGGNNPGYSSVLGDRPELLADASQSLLLADRIIDFLSNTQKADAAHQWQTQVVKKYSVDIVGPQIISTYQQLIASKKQR